jgi:hypothetical protein
MHLNPRAEIPLRPPNPLVGTALLRDADVVEYPITPTDALDGTATSETTMTIRTLAATAVTILILAAPAARAAIVLQDETLARHSTDAVDSAADRLLIVNANNGRVIYDDGRDDLFCVSRKVIVGYDHFGHPIRKRTMNCR